MKNKYVERSRISEAKFREIIKLFSLDLEADKVAQIVNLSRNTINKYFKANLSFPLGETVKKPSQSHLLKPIF